MTKVEVETFENVMVLQRSLKTEASARAVLLECAGAFSPRIEDRSVDGLFVCVADVAGTEGLFGPPLMLAKHMRQRIRSVGIVASVSEPVLFLSRPDRLIAKPRRAKRYENRSDARGGDNLVRNRRLPPSVPNAHTRSVSDLVVVGSRAKVSRR